MPGGRGEGGGGGKKTKVTFFHDGSGVGDGVGGGDDDGGDRCLLNRWRVRPAKKTRGGNRLSWNVGRKKSVQMVFFPSSSSLF